MASDPASANTIKTTVERIAHYREQAAQFRQWAETEASPEVRDGLLDMARQYERLASDWRSGSAGGNPRGRGRGQVHKPGRAALSALVEEFTRIWHRRHCAAASQKATGPEVLTLPVGPGLCGCPESQPMVRVQLGTAESLAK